MNKKILTASTFLFISMSHTAFASFFYSNSDIYIDNSLTNPLLLNKQEAKQILNCWDHAGVKYGVDPWLLFAIAKTESAFNPRAVGYNKDKKNNILSLDLGLMQINSTWLPTLNKYGIGYNHLMDPCTSIYVGAWILRQNINNLGYNLDGIGAYNSPRNVTIRRKYAMKVYSNYHLLVAKFNKK